MNEQPSLGIAEAAAQAHVNADTIRRKIKNGELPARQEPGPGGKYLIQPAALEEWLRQYRSTGFSPGQTLANPEGADSSVVRLLQDWVERAETGRRELTEKLDEVYRREEENIRRMNERILAAVEEKAVLQTQFKEFLGRINDFSVFYNSELARAREGRIPLRNLRPFPCFIEKDAGVVAVQPDLEAPRPKRARLLARLFNF